MKLRMFLNKLDDCILDVFVGEKTILSISSTDVFKKVPEIEKLEGNGEDDVDLRITFGNAEDAGEWTFEYTKQHWQELMEAEVIHVYNGEDLEIEIKLES